jgi:hypothetical protein
LDRGGSQPPRWLDCSNLLQRKISATHHSSAYVYARHDNWFLCGISSSIVAIIDARQLAYHLFRFSATYISLERLLSVLDLKGWQLHNSGNDAVSILKELIHLFCICQTEISGVEQSCVLEAHGSSGSFSSDKLQTHVVHRAGKKGWQRNGQRDLLVLASAICLAYCRPIFRERSSLLLNFLSFDAVDRISAKKDLWKWPH